TVRKPDTHDLFEPWVTISIELPLNPTQLAEHCMQLEKLAKERNALIHHELSEFNFESDEDCKQIIMHLENQNTTILNELNFLKPAIESLIELNKIDHGTEIH
ncbi:MAG TPA: hypothetical protein VHL14_04795, partial [Steroidobacteraceae bacterium]|nr:hypothetical protein [Steroidobacteraceae bacterium]